MASGIYVNVSVPGGNSGVAGPFSGQGQFQLVAAGIRTYKSAQAAQAAAPQTLDANQVQVFEQVVLEGPGVGQGFFGLSHDVQNVPNPFSAVTSVADALAKFGGLLSGFAQVITDASMWRSLGWIVLGAVLLFTALGLWLKKQDVIPDVVPVPV